MTNQLTEGQQAKRTAGHRDKSKAAYLFMSPWFIGFFTLTAIPMAVSLYLSFTDFSLLGSPEWTGLDHYRYMFTRDFRFDAAIHVTFFYVFASVPITITLALLVAQGLNQGMRGEGILRSAYYLPSLLGGSVAIAVMWRQIFGQDGLVNQILELFGFDGPSWLGEPDLAPWTLVFLHVWQFGAPMVIFLAGLKQLPPDLFEAARVDGANAFQVFRRITIPLLTPLIFFNLVMQVIVSFQAFTPAFILSNGTGAPGESTLFYTLYLYLEGFINFRMGYAAALAWVLVAIIAAVTGFLFATSRFWVYNPER